MYVWNMNIAALFARCSFPQWPDLKMDEILFNFDISSMFYRFLYFIQLSKISHLEEKIVALLTDTSQNKWFYQQRVPKFHWINNKNKLLFKNVSDQSITILFLLNLKL